MEYVRKAWLYRCRGKYVAKLWYVGKAYIDLEVHMLEKCDV